MADAEALVRRDGKMIHPGDSPIVRQRRPCRRSQGVFDQGGAGIVWCLRISRTVHCLCLRTGHHRRGTCELPASRRHTFRQLPLVHPRSEARPMACRKLAAWVNSVSPPLVDRRTAYRDTRRPSFASSSRMSRASPAADRFLTPLHLNE